MNYSLRGEALKRKLIAIAFLPLIIGFSSAAAYSSYSGMSETGLGFTSAPAVLSVSVNVTGYGQNPPQGSSQYVLQPESPPSLVLSSTGGDTVVMGLSNQTFIQHLSDSEGNGIPLYAASISDSLVLHIAVSHYTAGEWFQLTLLFKAASSAVNLGSPALFYTLNPGEVSNLSLQSNPQNGLNYQGTSSDYFTTQGLRSVVNTSMKPNMLYNTSAVSDPGTIFSNITNNETVMSEYVFSSNSPVGVTVYVTVTMEVLSGTSPQWTSDFGYYSYTLAFNGTQYARWVEVPFDLNGTLAHIQKINRQLNISSGDPTIVFNASESEFIGNSIALNHTSLELMVNYPFQFFSPNKNESWQYIQVSHDPNAWNNATPQEACTLSSSPTPS